VAETVIAFALVVMLAVLIVGLLVLRDRFAKRESQRLAAMLARAQAADEAVRARVEGRRPFDEYHHELDDGMDDYQVVTVEVGACRHRGIVSPDGARVLKPSPLLLDHIDRDHGGLK
jgi:type II secretory pathway pseudopilin PulG